jgi:hypothetical protein
VGFVGVVLGLQGLFGVFLWVFYRVLPWVVAFGLVGAPSELGSSFGCI